MDALAQDVSTSHDSAVAVPAAKASCSFRDMRLRVGDRVQLEPPQQIGVGRLAVKVVGWVEGHSLILTAPHTPKGRLELHKGEIVVLRAFTGRSAFAFRCSVLKSTMQPFDYLHLSFPESIDGVDVRSSPRFRVGAPAKVVSPYAGEPIAVRIDNISSTGALLIADSALGAIGESIKLEFDTVLHEIPVSLLLDATIRSLEEDPGKGQHRHGVSFVDPQPNDRLILAALVWFNMYENPKLSA